MGNKIRLTESELNSIIRETVQEVLSEIQGSNENVFEIPNNFQIMADKLKEMSWQLDGFIKEYQIFVKAVYENTQRLGLVLKNASTPNYVDLDNMTTGSGAEFEYEFGFNTNVDINQMSDEEYDAWQKKLESIADDLEIEINPRNFKFGQVGIQVYETSISITYEFNFWD